LKIQEENYLNSVIGDGGVYSNLDDLFLWCRAVLDPVKSGLFFNHETVELLTDYKVNDEPSAFVLGQNREIIEGLEISAFELEGGWVGYSSFINRIPELDFFVIALANSDSNAAPEIADTLTNLLVFNQE